MHQRNPLPLFRTPVDIAAPLRPIDVDHCHVFLGSCFAEHVGRQFQEHRLTAVVNPLGTMYNPQSIARLLDTGLGLAESDFVCDHEGMWHTWLGASLLSRSSYEACRQATEEALDVLHAALSHADYLFLTFGTSHYYTLAGTGQPVANCHRLPSATFSEQELSVDEIVTLLDVPLAALHASNPTLQVVLTVSPYRYRKYGFHASALSKSRLLLATDALCSRYPQWVSYFPAYEIVLDELRDYRFYAEDMVHPSSQAVAYVWQRLCESWMAPDVQDHLRRYETILRAEKHQPIMRS